MANMTNDERELPTLTAVALTRAHLQHQRGQLSDDQLRDAVHIELAAVEDLTLVIEAQALISAAILNSLMPLIDIDGVTAESYLLGLERAMLSDDD